MSDAANRDELRSWRHEVRRPWLPASLAARGFTQDTVGGLSYLVVEEMVEDITSITVFAWPAADGFGRLRFDVEHTSEVAMPSVLLYRQVYRGWLNRRPRIGDLFAAHVDTEAVASASTNVWTGPLAVVMPNGLYDLSADGRAIAKLALLAARCDVLTSAEARQNRMPDPSPDAERVAPFRELSFHAEADPQ